LEIRSRVINHKDERRASRVVMPCSGFPHGGGEGGGGRAGFEGTIKSGCLVLTDLWMSRKVSGLVQMKMWCCNQQ
jgi:hypothetical protein